MCVCVCVRACVRVCVCVLTADAYARCWWRYAASAWRADTSHDASAQAHLHDSAPTPHGAGEVARVCGGVWLAVWNGVRKKGECSSHFWRR